MEFLLIAVIVLTVPMAAVNRISVPPSILHGGQLATVEQSENAKTGKRTPRGHESDRRKEKKRRMSHIATSLRSTLAAGLRAPGRQAAGPSPALWLLAAQKRLHPDDQPAFEAWFGRPFTNGTDYFELAAQIPIRRP
jgi:hypothetical protein